jgi:hypothetical protein
MSLHRDIMCGNGFYGSLVGYDDADTSDMAADMVSLAIEPAGNKEVVQSPPVCPALPVVDFLGIESGSLRQALIDENLADDRSRFTAYMSKRPCGVALIVSPVSVCALLSQDNANLLTCRLGSARRTRWLWRRSVLTGR